MSWNLIRAIRNSKSVDMRPVRPYGLGLKLGDVIKVHRNGNLSLEGNCRSLLAETPPRSRKGSSVNFLVQSEKGTSFTFRPSGKASSLFPELPSTQAGFDIEFADAHSWLLAVTGRVITMLTEQNRFRRPILEAYNRNVWQADWALVTQVGMVEKMTLLAASTSDTKVALSVAANVAADAAIEVKLTAEASISKTSKALEQWITDEPASAFCNAVRVKDGWFTKPGIESLKAGVKQDLPKFEQAPDKEVWQDVDDIES